MNSKELDPSVLSLRAGNMGCVRDSMVLEKGMLGLSEKTWAHPQPTVTDRSLEQPLLLPVPGTPAEARGALALRLRPVCHPAPGSPAPAPGQVGARPLPPAGGGGAKEPSPTPPSPRRPPPSHDQETRGHLPTETVFFTNLKCRT